MKLRRLLGPCLTLVVLSLSAYPATAQAKSEGSLREQFAGGWQLVSIETIRPNGEVIYPFYGRHPQGLIIYDASGWMSVQIVSDPPPTLPRADSREDFLAAPPADKVNAADGYYGYFGTWTVDAAKRTVTHHIKQSFYGRARRGRSPQAAPGG